MKIVIKFVKIVWTILVLISNVLIRRSEYNLEFIKSNGRWYYKFPFPGWGFNQKHLEMISGADNLCEEYSKFGRVRVKLLTSEEKFIVSGYDEYIKEEIEGSFWDHIVSGRIYNGRENSFWICPVTIFVLGRYPRYLYIKNES